MPNVDEMAEVPGSVLKLNDNAMQLYRPINGLKEACQFGRLRCKCGCIELEVDRTDDGWCVECPNCGEASMLGVLINGEWENDHG